MKVFVGLSGGVDSATSAYLLKKAGHDVVGVFLKVWEPDFLPCTGPQDRLDAMRVAAHLEIPFITYNLEEEYKKGVVDYFIAEYKAGRTPNPDVMCNREIKFGSFWEKAQADGADAIATGHYSQVREGHIQTGLDVSERTMTASSAYAQNKLLETRVSNNYAMYRGVDEGKDQSYFLWTLTQDDLSHVLFPIGGFEKSEVRKIAEEAGLPNFDRKDSQGLCFLGHVDMEEFLKHYVPVEQGVVRTVDGREIATHDGVIFYTIGQRFAKPGSEKWYVVSKDLKENVLIVAPEPHVQENERTVVHLSQVNWIHETPDPEKMYEAQTRYHGEKHAIKIQVNSVQFEQPVMVAPGQSLVVYDPETGECMGGGIMNGNANNR